MDVVVRVDAGESNHSQAGQGQTDAAQGTLGLAVLAYRNLSKLLPERLVIKQE